jgi:hypothetical protein
MQTYFDPGKEKGRKSSRLGNYECLYFHLLRLQFLYLANVSLLELVTDSMHKSHSRETDSHSASQEVSALHTILIVITVLLPSTLT